MKLRVIRVAFVLSLMYRFREISHFSLWAALHSFQEKSTSFSEFQLDCRTLYLGSPFFLLAIILCSGTSQTTFAT